MNTDEWGIKPLQNCILNIAKYIHEFCQDNNIVYYLAYGSVLGAVRHQGFIPWDDDMDVYMTIENYKKFRNAFNIKGDKHNFYLQEFGVVDGLPTKAKLRMNNTYFHEIMCESWDIHHGIFIDIFFLHELPDDNSCIKSYCFWNKYLYFLNTIQTDYQKKGSFIRYVFMVLRKIIPSNFLRKYATRKIRKFDGTPNAYYYGIGCNLTTTIERSLLPSSMFSDRKLIDYETIKLYVPSGYHDYLTHEYKDYMKFPSKEQIKFSQHAADYWLDKSFIPRKGGTFADEG